MFALCVLGFGRGGGGHSDHFGFNELDLLSHLGDIGSWRKEASEALGLSIDYLTVLCLQIDKMYPHRI